MAVRHGIPYHLVSTASNNALCVRAGMGEITNIWVTNINAAIMFVKFFDTVVVPLPGTDPPVFVLGVPGGGAAGAGGSMAIPDGLSFLNGIGIAMVVNAADTDNTPVAAGDLVLSFIYR
jgi:hypothetical protein